MFYNITLHFQTLTLTIFYILQRNNSPRNILQLLVLSYINNNY